MSTETTDYLNALRAIREACAKPFGKDARAAKRIANEVLEKWGKKNS